MSVFQEDFLHFVWKFKRLTNFPLYTVDQQEVIIHQWGLHNHHAGPDFSNARITIGDQQWAGNVEMHLKSSDWYVHGHDDDPAYDNVILHVVWEHDAEINRRDGTQVPVLILSPYVHTATLSAYNQLLGATNEQKIPCQSMWREVDDFLVGQWLQKVFIERLEVKANRVKSYLAMNQGDWEAAFFQLLARSFGGNVNADAFEQLAQSIPGQEWRQLARDAFQLEVALMGQAGLYQKEYTDPYYTNSQKEYQFLQHKYNWQPAHTPVQFFRLRPPNFPTIRLSQLAMLYHREPLLFGQILLAKTRKDLHQLFEVSSSMYWETHYVFDKTSKKRKKSLSASFIDLIIINAVVPIKFCYAQWKGEEVIEELFTLMSEVSAESNTVVKAFKNLVDLHYAWQSQSVIHLKKNYCDVRKCLQCDIGVALLKP